MNRHQFKILVLGIFATSVLALAVGIGAQTPAPSATTPTAGNPQASHMTGHKMDSATMAKHEADMKADCQAMMAKKQEMKDKCAAMDASLDKLVAEMNAAKESKKADAMEIPMAAVITELVAQRKAMRAMMEEMDTAMMAHMMNHMTMHGARGSMECPTMKTGTTSDAKPAEKMPKM
jgi:hypothetical protein